VKKGIKRTEMYRQQAQKVKKGWKSALKKLEFHPFLFAFYPVLFLYTHNHAQIPISDILFPLIGSLILASMAYGLMMVVYKDGTKAAFIVSIALLLFFFYGNIYELLKTVLHFLGVPKYIVKQLVKDRFLIPIVFCGISFLGMYIFYSKKKFIIPSKFLTALSLILIAINCGILAKETLFKGLTYHDSKKKESLSLPHAINEKPLGFFSPDIYLFTLDEFAGFNTIKNYYNYDPSWFVDFLVKKGFYIIPQSRSNYACTNNCLRSILNMDYIHKEPGLYDSILIASQLKKQGYQFYNSIPPNTILDGVYLKMNSELVMELIHVSMLKSIGPEFHRFKILYLFNNFSKIMREKSPKIVHIYFMCPHVPFIFDSSGNRLPYNDKENWKNKAVYRGQWIFMAKKIESVIDSIFLQSQIKPIIILQSDHGVRALPRGKQSPPLISDENGIVYIENDKNKPLNYYQLFTNNFNAFYFPDGNYSSLYDSLSPVNTFRIVLNHVFKTNYAMCPDQSYIGPAVSKGTKEKDSVEFLNVSKYARW